MNEKALAKHVSAWPGAASDVKWGDDLVWSVRGKMFAVLCLRGEHAGRLSFKVDDDRFLEFTDRPGIVPAPYMARAKWITVADPHAMSTGELRALLRRSYELVRAKLPKATQRELAAPESARHATADTGVANARGAAPPDAAAAAARARRRSPR